MNRDRCLHNVEDRHDHRCPYYDHDVMSCDKADCPSHHADEPMPQWFVDAMTHPVTGAVLTTDEEFVKADTARMSTHAIRDLQGFEDWLVRAEGNSDA